MQVTPESEIRNRIRSLQELLKRNDVDGVLIVQGIDLFYFTGAFQNAYLYVPAEGRPVLMVRKSYERTLELSPLENIVRLEKFKDIPRVLSEFDLKSPETLGLEFDVLPVMNYFRIQKIFDGSSLVDCSPWIRQLRAVKSPYEIELMREAGAQIDRVFARVPELLEAGCSEVELAGRVEAEARRFGHQGILRTRGFNQEIFYGTLLCGANGAIPSYFDGPLGGVGCNPSYPFGSSNRPVKRNEPVVLDFGGIVGGYMVDVTRTFVIGEVDPELERAHELALKIQETIVEMGRPGVTCGELFDRALQLARANGLEDHFMGGVSFIGHGVGLELDELPVLSKGSRVKLVEGMTVAVEPKFVFPGRGAVGIENTFVVTAAKLERLTHYPDDLQKI